MRVIWTAVLVLVEVSASAKADSWAPPRDREYMSAGGDYVFKVKVADRSTRQRGPCRATLSQFWNGKSRTVWEGVLVNRISPVRAMVHDSGRFVVTFDEWYQVGTNPVVVYGEKGELIGHPSVAELLPAEHPRITRSVSSYWWNQNAMMFFGPPAGDHPTPWRRKLEETLFIRLYWGHVVSVDLSTGKPVAENDTRGLPAGQARFLARETSAFLEEHFRRLAKEYLHERNFFPDPTSEGIKGILLAMQSRLREPLPLLRKVAATDRFAGWAAPSIRAGRTDLKSFAEDAVREIEGEAANCVGSFQE